MCSIAACYSDHTVKVSDSYRSGHVLSNLTPSNPLTISSSYRFRLSTQTQFLIVLHWSSNKIHGDFSIDVNFTSRQFSTNKGAKKFHSGDSEISVFWDLSEVMFDPGPDLTRGFYLVVTVDSEVGLLLGDEEEKLTRLGILKIRMARSSLVARSEWFYGFGSVYTMMARFCEGCDVHEIWVRAGEEI